MKKNRFFSWLAAAVALCSVSSMTSCVSSSWEDTGLASLTLSTNSIIFDFDGGVQSFTIEANRDWEISIPSADEGWLHLDYTNGIEGQRILLSASASTSSRYSDVTVRLYNSVGTIFSRTISITQGTVVDDTTLAYASRAENAGKTYSGLSGTVVARTSVSYVVCDDTGGILIYAGGTPPFAIGDVVEISGTTVAYAGLSQFSNDAKVSKIGEAEVDFSSPQVMTGSELDLYSTSTPTVKYVKYTGTLSVSGNYVNIDIDGASSAKGSLAYVPSGMYDASLDGASVDIYGYLVGVTGTVYVNTAAVCVVAAGDSFVEPDYGETAPETEDEELAPGELPEYELTGAIKASDFTSVNATDAPSAIFGNYKFVWSGGGNSLSPKYYTSGDAIRMYTNNTLTVSTIDGSNITSIDFELVSSFGALSCSTGAISSGCWTGEASSVTFTTDLSSTSNTNTRISTIVVDGYLGGDTDGEGEGEGEVTPEPEPEGEGEPESDVLPEYALTGVVKASDIESVNDTAAPDVIFGNYKFVWSNGGNSLSPKYFTSGDAIRMYINNTLTISTVDGAAIKSIDITMLANYDFLSCDTGSISSGSWTGEASSVTFTSTATSSRITSFVLDGFYGDDYVAPSYSFSFSSIADSATTDDATYTISDVDFVVNNASYSSSYGNMTIFEGGYIYNSSALEAGFVTITINYTSTNTSYHNAKLYAGESVNPTVEMTTKSTSGTAVSFSVPATTTHFKVTSESGFVYVLSVEMSNEAISGSDPTPDPEPEPEGETGGGEGGTEGEGEGETGGTEGEGESEDNDVVAGAVIEVTYTSILDAMGKTSDDVSSSAGLSLVDDDVVFSGFTMSADKAAGSTNFRLWANGTTIRSYVGNTVTFVANGAENIISIEFNVAAIGSASVGTATTTVWSGNAQEVTLTMTTATISSINVTLAAAE